MTLIPRIFPAYIKILFKNGLKFEFPEGVELFY